jgi:hypothetical protein
MIEGNPTDRRGGRMSNEILKSYNYTVLDRQAPAKTFSEQAAKMSCYATLGFPDVPTGVIPGETGEVVRDELRRIKIEVHWDTSYANQSRASLAVWSGDRWEQVVSLLGVETYEIASRQQGYPWYSDIEERLITTGSKILGLTSLEEINTLRARLAQGSRAAPTEILAGRGARAVLAAPFFVHGEDGAGITEGIVDQDAVFAGDQVVKVAIGGTWLTQLHLSDILEFLPADGPGCAAGGASPAAARRVVRRRLAGAALDEDTMALKRMVAHLIVLPPLGDRPDDQISMSLAAREKLRNVVELRLGRRGIPLTWYEMSDELFAKRVSQQPLSTIPEEK